MKTSKCQDCGAPCYRHRRRCVTCGQEYAAHKGANLTPEQRQLHARRTDERYAHKHERRDEMIRRASAGEPYEVLARECGVSAVTVRCWCEKAGKLKPRILRGVVVNGVEYASMIEASFLIGVSKSAIRTWCLGWTCRHSGKKYPPRPNCYMMEK